MGLGMLTSFRPTVARLSRAIAFLVFLLSPGCATNGWFRPVAGADNATPVFCAAESPHATSMVVAVRVAESVESAAFTVQAIETSGPVVDEGKETRGGVNLLPNQTICVRVPLLAPLDEFRRYTVSIDGYRAGQHVQGGTITCTPKFIRNWPCRIQ
jgi:hypothetical protein